MASSTSEVETVRGDKLPTIGQLQVPLSFNGRKFTCQFHVIENMTYNAVLGRDFLFSNGAVINFASGTVSLDKVKPIELTLKPIDLRPLVSLSVHNSHPTNRNHDETAIPFLIKLIPYDHFGQQLKKAAIFFLKFLIILLLMSPHGHVTTARDYQATTAKDVGPLTSHPEYVHSHCPLPNIHTNQHFSPEFLFLLTPVRLKVPLTTPSTITPSTAAINTFSQAMEVNLFN